MMEGIVLLFVLILIVPYVLFLVSLSKFVGLMRLKDRTKETSGAWIWTQLIPIWSFVAIPVMLLKLNEQYKTYIEENQIDLMSIKKRYDQTWGWIYYGISVASMFLSIIGLFAIAAFIVYWINIVNARKSLEDILFAKQNNQSQEEA